MRRMIDSVFIALSDAQTFDDLVRHWIGKGYEPYENYKVTFSGGSALNAPAIHYSILLIKYEDEK